MKNPLPVSEFRFNENNEDNKFLTFVHIFFWHQSKITNRGIKNFKHNISSNLKLRDGTKRAYTCKNSKLFIKFHKTTVHRQKSCLAKCCVKSATHTVAGNKNSQKKQYEWRNHRYIQPSLQSQINLYLTRYDWIQGTEKTRGGGKGRG